jgi:phosphoribosyl-AMP cyclohydrolase
MELDFEKQGGLVPAIVQDAETNDVLMLAYMNKEAWDKTLETKKAHYYSRSRNTQWMKGESSGNIQEVKEIFVDCDKDTVLLKIKQIGDAACHTGYRSCFYSKLVDGEPVEIGKKVFDPEKKYEKSN